MYVFTVTQLLEAVVVSLHPRRGTRGFSEPLSVFLPSIQAALLAFSPTPLPPSLPSFLSFCPLCLRLGLTVSWLVSLELTL